MSVVAMFPQTTNGDTAVVLATSGSPTTIVPICGVESFGVRNINVQRAGPICGSMVTSYGEYGNGAVTPARQGINGLVNESIRRFRQCGSPAIRAVCGTVRRPGRLQ